MNRGCMIVVAALTLAASPVMAQTTEPEAAPDAGAAVGAAIVGGILGGVLGAALGGNGRHVEKTHMLDHAMPGGGGKKAGAPHGAGGGAGKHRKPNG